MMPSDCKQVFQFVINRKIRHSPTIVNAKEDQQSRILEKIRSMEDRDRTEAERLGAKINDP